MAPGDFVRVSRQLTDVLRQLRDAVDELSDDAAATLAMVDRGVVAAQGIG
jgi:superfamily II RNA helicase